MKKEKGITLIALVITIIVLLILAGIAIAMLSGENGILKKASDAKTKAEKAQENEIEDLAIYEDGINENTGNLKKVKDYKKEQKVVKGRKVKLQDDNGETIVVPVGFKIKDDSPTEVKRGIVVVAPDGSEFVWIPVKDVSKMYGTNKNGSKLGKLYSFATGYTALNWTEKDGVMSFTNGNSNIEPAVLSENKKYSKKEDNRIEVKLSSNTIQYKYKAYLKNLKASGPAETDIYPDDIYFNTDSKINKFLNDIKEEYDNMITSVEKNKGFYVGRYETSLNTETKNAQSISGVKSATAEASSANTWYGLYQKQKEYNTKNNLTNVVGSSMIWGSQYDQMMIWMQENGIDVSLFTPNDFDGTATSRNTTRITGAKLEDKLNNIYDLLGNSHEWTLEADMIYSRTYRSGSFQNSSQLYYRYSIGPKNNDEGISSRMTLYIK